MILFKCDRCKKVITPYVYRLGFEAYSNRDYGNRNPVNSPWVEPGDKGYVKDDLSEKVYSMHLCRDCVEQVAAVVLNYNTEETKIFEGGGTGHTRHRAGSGSAA